MTIRKLSGVARERSEKNETVSEYFMNLINELAKI